MRNTSRPPTSPAPLDAPDAELPKQALGFRVQGYGMTTWADLFTNRQLTALTMFSDLVTEARASVLADAAMNDTPMQSRLTWRSLSAKLADYEIALCAAGSRT